MGRRLSLPASVKIGHVTYRVEPMSREEAEREKAFAYVIHEQAVIRVQEDLPSALAAEKLLHEILHGVYDVWEIDARWGEERTVTALAKALAAIIQDNPDVMRWVRRSLRRKGRQGFGVKSTV